MALFTVIIVPLLQICISVTIGIYIGTAVVLALCANSLVPLRRKQSSTAVARGGGNEKECTPADQREGSVVVRAAVREAADNEEVEVDDLIGDEREEEGEEEEEREDMLSSHQQQQHNSAHRSLQRPPKTEQSNRSRDDAGVVWLGRYQHSFVAAPPLMGYCPNGYELSGDFQQKQIAVLERKYGGTRRAQRAASIIQRAYRYPLTMNTSSTSGSSTQIDGLPPQHFHQSEQEMIRGSPSHHQYNNRSSGHPRGANPLYHQQSAQAATVHVRVDSPHITSISMGPKSSSGGLRKASAGNNESSHGGQQIRSSSAERGAHHRVHHHQHHQSPVHHQYFTSTHHQYSSAVAVGGAGSRSVGVGGSNGGVIDLYHHPRGVGTSNLYHHPHLHRHDLPPLPLTGDIADPYGVFPSPHNVFTAHRHHQQQQQQQPQQHSSLTNISNGSSSSSSNGGNGGMHLSQHGGRPPMTNSNNNNNQSSSASGQKPSSVSTSQLESRGCNTAGTAGNSSGVVGFGSGVQGSSGVGPIEGTYMNCAQLYHHQNNNGGGKSLFMISHQSSPQLLRRAAVPPSQGQAAFHPHQNVIQSATTSHQYHHQFPPALQHHQQQQEWSQSEPESPTTTVSSSESSTAVPSFNSPRLAIRHSPVWIPQHLRDSSSATAASNGMGGSSPQVVNQSPSLSSSVPLHNHQQQGHHPNGSSPTTSSTSSSSAASSSVVAVRGGVGAGGGKRQPTDKERELQRKRQYRIALNFFNKKPDRGMQFLMNFGFTEKDPKAVAKFLMTRRGLSKQMIGEFLGNLQSSFNSAVLECFVDEVDMKGIELDVALRKFLSLFRLPGEAQKIERIIEVFARRFCECNVGIVDGMFREPDTVFVLSFAIIMLNTDLHSPNLKEDKRMKLPDFIKNLRRIDGNNDIDSEYLTGIYNRVQESEFKSGSDHTTQVLKVDRSIVGKKPNLALPHRRLVCYCRLYEVDDPARKQSPALHQREIFLFNDLIMVTKILSRKKNIINYSYRQSYSLVGMQIQSFKNQYYPHGLKIYHSLENKTLYFHARSEDDKQKFMEDLRESIIESDEMEALRIELELEKQSMIRPATLNHRPDSQRDSGLPDIEQTSTSSGNQSSGGDPSHQSTVSSTSSAGVVATIGAAGSAHQRQRALSNSLLELTVSSTGEPVSSPSGGNAGGRISVSNQQSNPLMMNTSSHQHHVHQHQIPSTSAGGGGPVSARQHQQATASGGNNNIGLQHRRSSINSLDSGMSSTASVGSSRESPSSSSHHQQPAGSSSQQQQAAAAAGVVTPTRQPKQQQKHKNDSSSSTSTTPVAGAAASSSSRNGHSKSSSSRETAIQ